MKEKYSAKIYVEKEHYDTYFSNDRKHLEMIAQQYVISFPEFKDYKQTCRITFFYYKKAYKDRLYLNLI